MEKRIEELYQQYLSGQLSQSDFEQLQRKVVQTSDEDLWNLMCGEFSSSASSAKMPHNKEYCNNFSNRYAVRSVGSLFVGFCVVPRW